LLVRLAAQYGELLSLVSRSGAISPRLIDSRIQAGVPELLVAELLARGPCNVSELARWLRERRGRASRGKIRKELEGLVELGVVRLAVSPRRYTLSPDFLASYVKLIMGGPGTALEILDSGWGRTPR
jgi:hypothetical protein